MIVVYSGDISYRNVDEIMIGIDIISGGIQRHVAMYVEDLNLRKKKLLLLLKRGIKFVIGRVLKIVWGIYQSVNLVKCRFKTPSIIVVLPVSDHNLNVLY